MVQIDPVYLLERDYLMIQHLLSMGCWHIIFQFSSWQYDSSCVFFILFFLHMTHCTGKQTTDFFFFFVDRRWTYGLVQKKKKG